MTTVVTAPTSPPPDVARPPAWRWVHVAVAALAMVATMPGRTQGLGLFTEPLLQSLSLDRESYGVLNTVATLLGALFCLPCGWLLDRIGTRATLFAVTTGLGTTVLAMSWFTTGAWRVTLTPELPDWLGGATRLDLPIDLFIFLLLTRGLGQSALSVVSLALIGRSAGRKPGPAMGVFAVLTALGFMAAFAIVGRPDEWRPAWAGIGVAVLVLGAVGSALVRNSVLADDPAGTHAATSGEPSFTLAQALATPGFWTFTLAISFLGLVLAGTSLYGESIMAERGLDLSAYTDHGLPRKVFVGAAMIGIPFGLATNLLAGWLAGRIPLAALMGSATVLFGSALLTFPMLSTELEVYAYAATLAVAGGGMTICFYSVYRRAFGPAHLGAIQGVAQMFTVLFSAAGQLVFASTKARLGAYEPLFLPFALVAFGLAILTLIAGLPKRAPSTPTE